MLKVKRVYDPPLPSDGFRILVDRLWPRGLSKEKAAARLWLREIAPSNALRKWFGHTRARWLAFQTRYRKELSTKKELLEQIHKAEKDRGTVTLLFAAHDARRNNAVALARLLVGKTRAKEVPRQKVRP